ncbi:MAG: hypothetical protein HONDAALG_02576 [Gammaproteobacteria bacterium]|nr:hypothetical protein [Gammaproteobacteria bacterium]
MGEKKNNEKKANDILWRTTAIALSILFLGGAISVVLELSVAKFGWNPKAAQVVITQQLANQLISAGFLGLIFQIFFRRKLAREFEEQIQDLFYSGPLAKNLKEDARKNLVSGVLTAHLGEEEGEAIFDGIVEGYIVGTSPFRRNFRYDVVISDLKNDIQIKSKNGQETFVTLDKAAYYGVDVHLRYERQLGNNLTTIGCVLLDDSQELKYWFDKDDCLFRDVVSLNEQDRQIIIDTLTKRSGEIKVDDVLCSIFKLQIKINGTVVESDKISVIRDGKSIEYRLKGIQQIAKKNTAKLAEYEIKVISLMSRESRNYPIRLIEPCKNPVVTFSYLAGDISNVKVFEFFSDSTDIDHREDIKRVTIQPRQMMRNKWIFPVSGVTFSWDRMSK